MLKIWGRTNSVNVKKVLWAAEELGLEYLTIFPHFPGMVREQVVDQMERFMAHVAPLLRKRAGEIEAAPPGQIDVRGAATTQIVSAQAKTRETIATSTR